MRTKEEANDYRYFPCPDLLPVMISDETLTNVKADMPELPSSRKARFVSEFGLSTYDANVLNGGRELSDYFLQVIDLISKNNAKVGANWVMGELSGALNKADLTINKSPISAERLAGLINRINDNTISGKIAKQVFHLMWENNDKTADQIITEHGLKQETDTGAIETIIKEVLDNNPKMVEEYKSGKEKAFNGLVGQVMKASKGKANPSAVNELMKKMLG